MGDLAVNLDLNEFYSNYDYYISLMCKPYSRFIRLGANSLPSDVREVCEIGVGTGNFISKVGMVRPKARLLGIDTNDKSLEKARSKVPGLFVRNADAFKENICSDYFISSLTLHHLPEPGLRAILSRLSNSSRGIINFDLVLSGRKTRDDAFDKIRSHLRNSFSTQNVDRIVEAMEQGDHFIDIDYHMEVLRYEGKKFQILAK